MNIIANNLFETSLFGKTTHNSSFASRTKQFTEINGLRDYCIPVNPYFPSRTIMEKLQARIIYALKYYPGTNESIAENIAQFSGIKNAKTIIAGNGSTEMLLHLIKDEHQANDEHQMKTIADAEYLSQRLPNSL